MNPRQKRFAHEYATSGNATQSAKDAGYAESSAHVTANRLLKNPKVKALISELQNEAFTRLGKDREWILRRLVENDQASQPRVVMRTIIDEDGKTVEEPVEVGNVHGSNKALELLGKHLALWVDRQEVEHSGGLDITINGVDVSNLK